MFDKLLLHFGIPVIIACIARTVTAEEIFREWKEYSEKQSKNARAIMVRKFFYVFTCEYCFSHYVALWFIWLLDFHLLVDDWRGYLLALFFWVFVANFYLGLFSLLRMDIKGTKAEAIILEKKGGKEKKPKKI